MKAMIARNAFYIIVGLTLVLLAREDMKKSNLQVQLSAAKNLRMQTELKSLQIQRKWDEIESRNEEIQRSIEKSIIEQQEFEKKISALLKKLDEQKERLQSRNKVTDTRKSSHRIFRNKETGVEYSLTKEGHILLICPPPPSPLPEIVPLEIDFP